MNEPIHNKQNTHITIGSLLLVFVLLSVTLTAAVWLVVRSARTVSSVTQTEKMVAKQRKATDHLLTQLLNASTQAETASMQYANNDELQRYLTASAQVDSALHRLKTLVKDKAQLQRIDSLQNLAWMRRDGMVQLINALRYENHTGTNLQQQIEALHKQERPVTMQVKVPVVERGEQVVIERRKRGFFRRLGDAFKRAKDDTLHTAVVQREATADTARAQVNIADTLANLLTGVRHHLQRDSLNQARRLYHKSDELRAASAMLSQRIATLIDNFTTAQQKLITQTAQREREQRQAAAFKLGAMALLAIILSASLMVWLWRDIRRANHYRRALESAKERSERLMTQREQLLLTISHDIKAPVNTMLGYLHLLPQTLVQTHHELNAVEASAQHLQQLVMALLDYHKLEAGGLTTHPSTTQIAHLLQSIFTAFQPLAQQKGLQLTAQVEVPLNLYVKVDALRLRQIVENLLSNAIKYTAQGSVTLHATWQAEPQQLQLSVTDTGCGMTQVDLNSIFKPFTRVKGSEGQEGTGLGLTITLKLVQLLKGSLIAHSKLHQGSKFVLTLPLQPCHADESTTNEAKELNNIRQANQTLPAHDLHAVLCAVLDDDTLQLQLTEAMLHNVLPSQSRVMSFNKADDLFNWVDAEHVPNWVLTDIEMPSLTGYEVLAALRQRKALRHVPVIAMTSHLLVPVDDFKQRGFADVLFKPFTQNDLLRILHHFTYACQGETDCVVSGNEPTTHPFKALLAFAEGDTAAETAILSQFAHDCQQHLQLFTTALAERNKSEVCRIAHKMLPTFTLISSKVVPQLQELENRRADQLWLDDDTTLCQHVVDELNRVIGDLLKFAKPVGGISG